MHAFMVVQTTGERTVCQARRGGLAYVCSTDQGAILELSMPTLKQARVLLT